MKPVNANDAPTAAGGVVAEGFSGPTGVVVELITTVLDTVPEVAVTTVVIVTGGAGPTAMGLP